MTTVTTIHKAKALVRQASEVLDQAFWTPELCALSLLDQIRAGREEADMTTTRGLMRAARGELLNAFEYLIRAETLRMVEETL